MTDILPLRSEKERKKQKEMYEFLIEFFFSHLRFIFG